MTTPKLLIEQIEAYSEGDKAGGIELNIDVWNDGQRLRVVFIGGGTLGTGVSSKNLSIDAAERLYNYLGRCLGKPQRTAEQLKDEKQAHMDKTLRDPQGDGFAEGLSDGKGGHWSEGHWHPGDEVDQSITPYESNDPTTPENAGSGGGVVNRLKLFAEYNKEVEIFYIEGSLIKIQIFNKLHDVFTFLFFTKSQVIRLRDWLNKVIESIN